MRQSPTHHGDDARSNRHATIAFADTRSNVIESGRASAVERVKEVAESTGNGCGRGQCEVVVGLSIGNDTVSLGSKTVYAISVAAVPQHLRLSRTSDSDKTKQ